VAMLKDALNIKSQIMITGMFTKGKFLQILFQNSQVVLVQESNSKF
jgi:hypothetical protein